MKVSLITLQSVRNYGSVLQAFATQSLFEQFGFKVEIIDYYKKESLSANIVQEWVTRTGRPLFLMKLILTPTIRKWERVFGTFIMNNLNLTPHRYVDSIDFQRYPISSDAYCVGSDQVWNSGWNNGFLGPLFLDFAPADAYKFAFSSSFGKQKLNDAEKPQIQKSLQEFNRISVRESQAVTILEDIGIYGASHILDPTLAVNSTFWKQQMSERMIDRPYLLIYQLNSNKDFDEYAVKLAKKMDLKLVRICTRYDQALKPGKSVIIPEVGEYVSLFYYADFILTDSFHGTGFSINFNKKFCSIYPEQFSSRISSILELVGLSNRHLKSFDDFEQPFEKVDYEYTNGVLQSERVKITTFLNSVKSDLQNNVEVSR